MARGLIILWNFAVGYFCTASIFLFHPIESYAKTDFATQFLGTLFEVIGGVVTALILTIFKKWGIQKYNLHKHRHSNRYNPKP